MFQPRHFLAGVASFGLAVALAGQAQAQDADVAAEPVQAGPAAAAEEADPAAGQAGEIVVTGSRITRRDYVSPSPIVTLGTDRLQQAGRVTLEQALNQLPQLASGTNASSQNNRSGRASLNLRGLGENRSLVLLDGRRLTPAAASGAVDINVLPTLAVENVETITGGASAVYGSDAMSGVVNFKLRRSFSGLMIDANQSITDRGDAQAREISVMAGSNFADDRGNALIVVSYADRDELLRNKRDFFRTSTLIGRLGNPVVNLGGAAPTQANVDAIFAGYGVPNGTVNRTTTFGVNVDGTLFTPAPGAGRPIVNYRGPLNDVYNVFDGSLQQNSGYYYNIVNPLERVSAFARLTYDVTDSIEAFLQFLHTSYDTGSTTNPSNIGLTGSTALLAANNQFIRGDLRRLLDLRPAASRNDPVSVTFTFETLGLLSSKSEWDESQIVGGLGGDLGIGDLSWSAYGAYGRTKNDILYKNAFVLSRAQELLGRADGGAGICAGGLDIFGPQQNISRACLDYIRADPRTAFKYEQGIVEATLQGGLFELPGGTLRFSIGADHRRESYDFDVDSRVEANDVPGIIQGSAGGSRNVTEFFGELLVPLLKDLPLIRSLEANLGYRYSDYSIGGGVESYTANLDWALARFFRLRGGYSRAIRAPSLEDLFSSAAQAQLRLGTPGANNTNGDPCDTRTSFRLGPNAAQVRSLCLGLGVPAALIDSYTFNASTFFGATTGNPALKPEKADTFSLGAVFEAPVDSGIFSRLRGSVDYFSIKIEDAVGQLPLATALARCFNLDGVSNPTYSATNSNCGFFPRNPTTGGVDAAIIPLLNLGKYKTTGVDFQLDWQIPLSEYVSQNLGTLQLNLVGTYLDSFQIQTLPGTATLDYAGASQSPIDPNGRASALPKWKWIASAAYSQGPARFGVTWRHIANVYDVSKVTNATSQTPGAKAKNYIDLLGTLEVADDFILRLGVNNLFDVQPPVLSATRGNTDTTTYDPFGRSFVVGLRKTF